MASFLKTSTMVLLIIFISFSFSEARDHLVGGKSNAWEIPSSTSHSLNNWAERSRFLIGDSLVWEYDGSKDSILEVTKTGYNTCNISSPIKSYSGGKTTVKLEKSGPYYFISGAEGHCEKGQKLIVVVMSQNHHRNHFVGISPAPSPVVIEGPGIAPSPTNGASGLRNGGLLVALGLGLLLVL